MAQVTERRVDKLECQKARMLSVQEVKSGVTRCNKRKVKDIRKKFSDKRI